MISTVTDPITSGPSQASLGPSKELGRDAFLNLLITQLQNQDPLNPTDSTELVFLHRVNTASSRSFTPGISDRVKAATAKSNCT